MFVEVAENFKYTNQGGDTRIAGVDDCAELAKTRNAFFVLGFRAEEVDSICKVLAGILHMGNISFEATLQTDSCIVTVCSPTACSPVSRWASPQFLAGHLPCF